MPKFIVKTRMRVVHFCTYEVEADNAEEAGNMVIEEGGIDAIFDEQDDVLSEDLISVARSPGADEEDVWYEALYSERGGYWYVDRRDSEGGGTVAGLDEDNRLSEAQARLVAEALNSGFSEDEEDDA
jgi:hypothetical protein